MNAKELRANFIFNAPHWGLLLRKGPRGRVLPQNEQAADTRVAWVDYVDRMARDGQISERVAQRATL